MGHSLSPNSANLKCNRPLGGENITIPIVVLVLIRMVSGQIIVMVLASPYNRSFDVILNIMFGNSDFFLVYLCPNLIHNNSKAQQHPHYLSLIQTKYCCCIPLHITKLFVLATTAIQLDSPKAQIHTTGLITWPSICAIFSKV